jgi:ADP-ribose pyrophosphatase YjhB (NUDIX family)
MPRELIGIPFTSWQPPASDEGWVAVDGQAKIYEPPFELPPGKFPAAGAVIEESDGRVWLVSPTNAAFGYSTTFPKGRVKAGASLQATAIRQAFEKAGLQVKLTGYFVDSKRDATFTRYYRAQRVSGNPADCSWQSQAVHLVPRTRLAELLTHPNDKPLTDALYNSRAVPRTEELLKYWTLSSAIRIVATMNCYWRRFRNWPDTVLIDTGTFDAIRTHVLTPIGWEMLNAKLRLIPIEEIKDLIALGNEGRVDYSEALRSSTDGPRADIWIWGIPLAKLMNEHVDISAQ